MIPVNTVLSRLKFDPKIQFSSDKNEKFTCFSKYTDKPLPISKIITYFASQNKNNPHELLYSGIYNVARSDYTAKNTNEP